MKNKGPKPRGPSSDSPFASLAKLTPQKTAAPVTKEVKAPVATPEEEALAFHRMMNGVKVFDQTNRRIPASQSSLDRSQTADHAHRLRNEPSEQAREDAAVHEHLRKLVEGPTRFEVQDDGDRVEGRRVELSHELLRKLRHGKIPVDAKLDLHGQGADDAKVALAMFIRDKRAKGERCLLIVHGKGEHSPGGIGVLRGEMAAWLSQGAASEHVAAFCTSTREHGGEGATYVLLRQRGV